MMTAQAMMAYAVGLLGLIGVKVLAPGFYAQQNVRTPVKIAIFTLVLTQLLNLVFVPVLDHAGLALATSVAALCNAGLLLIRLRQKGSYRPEAGWGWLWLKVLTAGLAMAALCWAAAEQFNWVALQAQPFTRLGALLGIVMLSAAAYLLMLTVLRVRWQDFLRRVPSASTSASTPPSP
jgi:putative peptidoglycan lipid II flippase